MELKHVMHEVERWGCFEFRTNGPITDNPFIDTKFAATFQYKHYSVTINGFYDGDGEYCVRYMPEEIGEWSFTTISNMPELNGLTGTFHCIAPSEHNHGPVKVEQVYHFAYADSKAFAPVGTTCYAWIHQTEQLQEQTLKSLQASPFNKIRMCLFPKSYDYNTAEPSRFPFAGNLQYGFDFARFNVEFWKQLEANILKLQQLGIECDLILFHPYDRWGFSTMDAGTDEFYLTYALSRLSAYRNIWWSLANEYDLMTKSMGQWDLFFRIIQQHDPYQHLRSIHNWHKMDIHYRSNAHWYDHGKPWVTHASIQHHDLWFVSQWREQYQKPIVVDECRYEGNLNHGWGNLTAEQMVECFWHGMLRGGYVSHGETFLHPNHMIWWSHGGQLHGDSPSRIAFLKEIIEQGPVIDAVTIDFQWDASAGGKDNEYYLVYFGSSRPAFRILDLPEHIQFKVELIDTWEMTITELEGTYQHNSRVDLPGKPYQALRIRAIK